MIISESEWLLQPDPKNSKKLINHLTGYFQPLVPASRAGKGGKKGNNDDAMMGEFATVMEAEVFPFVLFEIADPEMMDGK